jgi:hypothetical protein
MVIHVTALQWRGDAVADACECRYCAGPGRRCLVVTGATEAAVAMFVPASMHVNMIEGVFF